MTEEQLKKLLELESLEGINLDELAYQIKSLMNLSNIVCQKNYIDKLNSSFYPGELVIDTKNNEVGFVVGPICLSSEEKELKYYNTKVDVSKKKNRRYLLVTISELIKPNSLNSTSNEIEGSYRIRYTKEKHILPLGLEDNNIKEEPTDLEKFCKTQCILDCSNKCYLYKYKKNK